MYFDDSKVEDGSGEVELYTVEIEQNDQEGEGEEAVDNDGYDEEVEEETSDDDDDVDSMPMPVLQPQRYDARTYQYKFTAREKWIAVELVDHCKQVLLSKSAKTEVRRRKQQLWNEITNEINAQCGRHRPKDHVKRMWDYLSNRARKAEMQREHALANNRPAPYVQPLLQKVISIITGTDFGVNPYDETVVMYNAEDLPEEFKAVEIETSVPDDVDTKIDWYKVHTKQKHDEQQFPRNQVDEMRKLLLTTAPPRPRHSEPDLARSSLMAGRADNNFYQPETTYADVLEAYDERTAAERRMIEARDLMYAVKMETMSAKRAKLDAENYNLTMETLKLKHALGESMDFGKEFNTAMAGASQFLSSRVDVVKNETYNNDDEFEEEM